MFSVSTFQRDVSARLDEMGIQHALEYEAEEGLFSIDIAFSGPGGAQVALEVDGPWHFTRNTKQPLGSTLLRYATSAEEDSSVQVGLLLSVSRNAAAGVQKAPPSSARMETRQHPWARIPPRSERLRKGGCRAVLRGLASFKAH